MCSLRALSLVALAAGCAGAAPPHEPATARSLSDADDTSVLREPGAPRTVCIDGVGRVFPSDIAWTPDGYVVAYSDTPIGGRARLHLVWLSADGEVLADREVGFGAHARLAWNGRELGLSYSDRRPGWSVGFMRVTARGEVVPGSEIELSDGEADHARIAHSPRLRQWVIAWGQYRAPEWQVITTFIDDGGAILASRVLARGGGGFRFVADVVPWADRFVATLVPSPEVVELTSRGTTRSTPLEASWTGGGASMAADARGPVVAYSPSPNVLALVRVTGGQVARIGAIEESADRVIPGGLAHPMPDGLFVVWEAHTSAMTDSRLFFRAPWTAAREESTRLVAVEDYQSFLRIARFDSGIAVLHSVGHYNERPRACVTLLSDREARASRAITP